MAVEVLLGLALSLLAWPLVSTVLPLVLGDDNSRFIVQGESMMPTVLDGDRVHVEPLAGTPERGTLVVFDVVDVTGTHQAIKRVVGVPGDVVSTDGCAVQVTSADGTGWTMTEPYLSDVYRQPDAWCGWTAGPVQVGAAELFVLGDNRAVSLDSRERGPVSFADVVGVVVDIDHPDG